MKKTSKDKYPPHKNFEIQPTHIAHIAKATPANATTKALSKSAILPPLQKEIFKKYSYA